MFFAKAREILDRSEVKLQIAQTPLNGKSGLYNLLESSFPQLRVFKRTFAIALNEEYFDDDDNLDEGSAVEIVLQNKDTVAVIPHISGG